jgi:predicted nucleotidyltransferase
MNLQQAKDKLIFECIAGSRAYGTATPESDTDLRGVFTVPPAFYLRVHGNVEQVSDATNDTTYYTLKRFFQLAADANPNILELLFVPDDCVLKTSPVWEQVIAHRQSFISKRVLQTYGGYAVSQIKRAKGQNKLVHNPMPEEKPVKEDFCWIMPFINVLDRNVSNDEFKYHVESYQLQYPNSMPFRPIPLKDAPDHFNLVKYHCVPVEHTNNMYRLYNYGGNAKGVFRGDETADIVCESIPKCDEYLLFSGILIYNREAYESTLKKWKQYWDWKKNRNEARWVDQEAGSVDFDRKNMLHCMRLLYEGEHILQHGYPKVRFEGEELQRLLDIRFGELPYEEIVAEADERLADLDERRKTCTLPNTANLDLLSELLVELHHIGLEK